MRQLSFLAAGLALIATLLPASRAVAQPMPTVTYQGELTDASDTPVNGNCGFRFTLFPASSGGSAVAGPFTASSVTVTAGRFTALITGWPASSWNGDRWLQIEVSCPSGGPFAAPLAPRTLVTSAPTAAVAFSVTEGAIGAQQVDSTQVQRRLTGSCPAGSSIRAVDAAGAVTCESDTDSTYTAGIGLELVAAEFRAKGTPLESVITVAKSGGHFTTISAALASITDNGPDHRYLVSVAPGEYEEHVAMLEYVDIEGAGRGLTRITAAADSGAYTVTAAANTELRHLAVHSSSGVGDSFAIGINGGPNVRIVDVEASATGNTGGFDSAAIYCLGSAAPTIERVDATLELGAVDLGNIAAAINFTLCAGTITDTRAVVNSTADGNAVGLYVAASAPITLTGVVATCNCTPFEAGTGMLVDGAVSIVNATITGGAIGLNAIGARVYGSRITGRDRALEVHSNGFTFTRVANSMIDGSAFANIIGALECIGAYNENFSALNGGCQ